MSHLYGESGVPELERQQAWHTRMRGYCGDEVNLPGEYNQRPFIRLNHPLRNPAPVR